MRRKLMTIAAGAALVSAMTAGAVALIDGPDKRMAAGPTGPGALPTGSRAAAQTGMRTVTLAVDNIYCAACKIIVQRSLEKVDGVRNVTVSYRDKTAVVRYDSEICDLPDLTAATRANGFPSSILGAVR